LVSLYAYIEMHGQQNLKYDVIMFSVIPANTRHGKCK
jgi:hypothetical protein